MSASKIIELDETNTCKLCEDALAKYSCPKCKIVYCSVLCYQSEKHLECSESFYKDCIVEELSLQKDNGSAAYQKMLEILKDQHKSPPDDPAAEELDSDDDCNVAELTARLTNVNLDDADEVWSKLTPDEQQEFVAFIKSEDVSKLVPSWKPYWRYNAKNVADMQAFDDFRQANCPESIEARNFGDFCSVKPADCVRFNLINLLGAYAFITRYFNGEYKDFQKEVVSSVISISQTIVKNEIFYDYETALKSVQFHCNQSEWIVADAENFKTLYDDVEAILSGPMSTNRKFYVLFALSDLLRLFTNALNDVSAEDGAKSRQNDGKFTKTFPNDHFPAVTIATKRQIRAGLRKIEYFLAYVNEFY